MRKVVSIIKHSDLLFNNPKLFLRIAKDYFKLIALRQKVLRKVDIALTFDCNAKCQHCFSATLKDSDRQKLSLNRIVDCINQSLKLGAIAFEFTGGEPFLSAHLYEAVRIAKAKGVIVGVTTNGLLLTKETIRELKSARLDVLQISLDSVSSVEHDQSRGVTGCYEKAVRGLELAKAAGIKVIVSTIVTPKNISDNSVLKTIRWAKEKGALLNLNPACNVGKWSSEKNILLSEKHQEEYMRLMSFQHARWGGYMNFFREGCPCGRETIFITAYGDVLPCGFIQISYGNLEKESLARIWKKMLAISLKSEKRHTCIAGFDKDFMNKYLEPLNYRNKLPLLVIKHPEYRNL